MVKIKNSKVVMKGTRRQTLTELSTGIGAVIYDISKESGESPSEVADKILSIIDFVVRSATAETFEGNE